MDALLSNTAAINQLLARYGVKFGIYKDGQFHEQLFPFDSLPRVISAEEFAELEKGLIQRVSQRYLQQKANCGRRSYSRRLCVFLRRLFARLATSLSRLRVSSLISPGSIWFRQKIKHGMSSKTICGFLPGLPIR